MKFIQSILKLTLLAIVMSIFSSVAFGYEASDSDTKFDESEYRLQMTRVALKMLKDSGVNSVGRFDLITPAEFNFGEEGEKRVAIVTEESSDVTIDDITGTTSHKITINWVKTDDTEVVDAVMFIGKLDSGGLIGQINVHMREETPVMTITYVLDHNGVSKVSLKTSDGWTFEKDHNHDGVDIKDPENQHYERDENGTTCTGPELTAEQQQAIEERVKNGESFATIIAEYGYSGCQ